MLKGLKERLPTKLCAHCKRPMQMRKSWAKNWENVLYCSEKCSKAAKKKRSPEKNKNPALLP